MSNLSRLFTNFSFRIVYISRIVCRIQVLARTYIRMSYFLLWSHYASRMNKYFGLMTFDLLVSEMKAEWMGTTCWKSCSLHMKYTADISMWGLIRYNQEYNEAEFNQLITERCDLWSVFIELDTAQIQIQKNYWCRWASSGSGETNFIPDTICRQLTDQRLKTIENAFVTTRILERHWPVGQPSANHLSTVDRPGAPAGG